MSVSAQPTVGVVGAGTMGSGIAQMAALSGARTLLHDATPEALTAALEKIAGALDRLVEKGRLEASDAAAAKLRIDPATSLEQLALAEIVVEAAPERLDLKLEIFTALADVVADDCVLATNTSSLSVTEIAAGVPHPERVVGLHFFNPVPAMRLAEVVSGEDSSADAVARARALAEAMGKRAIDAADVAGFLVNRCNRPFSLEALRVLEQRLATAERIDAIARLGGGFRMGPFELMDLIGIETNHAVAESLQRQSYGEPRYRPSPLAARKIAAGHLGRKTRRGWFDHGDGMRRPADPDPPEPGGGEGRSVAIVGRLRVADALREAALAQGWNVTGDAAEAWLAVDCGDGSEGLPADVPRARFLHRGSLHALDPEAAGFHLLAPLDTCRLAETTATAHTNPAAGERLDAFLTSLGLLTEAVADAPGLVLGRIVCQLVNEAAFVLEEGNGSAADIDLGMTLGVNHPRGPLAWSEEIGLDHVLAVLDALREELGEERYRAAPALRRRHAVGQSLKGAETL